MELTKDWMSTDEYAEYMGVSPSTIRKKANQGTLSVAHEYIGRMLRIYPNRSETVVRLPEDQLVRIAMSVADMMRR